MTATATYNKPAFPYNYPAHWQLLRIKNIFTEIDERSETGSEELLSVSHYTGVTLKRENLENEDDLLTNAETLVGYKKVTKDDLIINIMGAWNGRLGISAYDGITSPAYCVYRIKGNNNPEYFGNLFSTNLMITEFRKKSKGVGNGFLRLYTDQLYSIHSVVPPIEEQNQIVEYIKKQSGKINRFIAQKQRFIDLLKEQRTSLVDKIINCGVSKEYEFVSTKIDWLKQVPKHWKIYRLRHLCKITTGSRNTEDRIEDGKYPFYVRSQTVEQINTYSFDGEGILTAGDGVGVGKVFHLVKGKFDFHQRVYLFYDFSDLITSEFLFYYLQNNMFKDLMRYNSKSTVDSIRLPVIKDFQVLIPPLNEQKHIVQHIKTETAIIGKTIAKAEREIELIKEYKEAMIAEAVMGKIEISKSTPVIKTKAKAEPSWEFKEAVLISVLTDKFGSVKFPLGRKRYTKFSYLFHRHTDNKTEGYLKKAAGPYNPKTKYGGPEKIALQNKYITETKSGNLSGFIASDKIQEAKNYFGHYWNADSLNWLEQLRYKKNDELELYATVDKAMVELAAINNSIDLLSVKQIIEENPEWKPKLEREIFSDENVTEAIKFLQQLFA
jgi:type I restriction enzyme S subunit